MSYQYKLTLSGKPNGTYYFAAQSQDWISPRRFSKLDVMNRRKDFVDGIVKKFNVPEHFREHIDITQKIVTIKED